MDYEKWRSALAMTESQNNPLAWGDEGLAVGRWQMHPAFVWDYGPDDVSVRESWDAVFKATLQEFFIARGPVAQDPMRLAMEFHLGVAAVGQGKWDAPYAARFKSFYESV